MNPEDISSQQTYHEGSSETVRADSTTHSERIVVPDVEIQKVVAWGGMSALYKGVQPFLNRTVAVKVLRQTGQWDATLVERFQREARLLAELDHPNIVSCFSAGRLSDDRCYLVMEFVEGPNLAEYVGAKGPLGEREALMVVRDMAAALAHAKERGIIHRDVKPQNILLKPVSSQPGTVAFPYLAKLADLGIARYESSAMGDTNLTQKGQFIGTPAYMAPEQFDDSDSVDHRADVYGLGGVLYFALGATTPFASQSVSDLLQKKAVGQMRPLREVAPTVSAPMEALVQDLLARDKEKRPQSYADLIARCDALLAGAPPAAEAPRKASGGFAIPVAIASVVVLAALGGFVLSRGGGDSSAKIAVVPEPKKQPVAVAAPVPTATPAPTPLPTATPAVRLPLEWAAPPKMLLTGDYLQRFEGWKVEGAFAPDEENEEGAIGSSVGSKPSELRRDLPPAPWRFAGQIDVMHGREAQLRFQGAGDTMTLRLQNLGATVLARTEAAQGPGATLGSFPADAPVTFTATFDGVELVMAVGEKEAKAAINSPATISLVAAQDSVAFRHITVQSGSR